MLLSFRFQILLKLIFTVENNSCLILFAIINLNESLDSKGVNLLALFLLSISTNLGNPGGGESRIHRPSQYCLPTYRRYGRGVFASYRLRYPL